MKLKVTNSFILLAATPAPSDAVVSNGPVSYFFGFTPWAGYYNNYGNTVFDPAASKKSFSVVNVGASITKALKITETYSLPIKTTLIINPSATYSRDDYVHLVFGITF